jgi:hypothetical protein
VPGGAAWRNSANVIFTEPCGNCARTFFNETGTSPEPPDLTSAESEAGSFARTDFKGSESVSSGPDGAAGMDVGAAGPAGRGKAPVEDFAAVEAVADFPGAGVGAADGFAGADFGAPGVVWGFAGCRLNFSTKKLFIRLNIVSSFPRY